VATIKTQLSAGQRRVITKVSGGQRRVSCSCCEELEEARCCLLDHDFRPATEDPPVGVGSINLFPEIKFQGQTLILDVAEQGYGNKTNGVFLEGNRWAVYKSGVRTTRACLVSDSNNDIEDTFPDQIAVTISAFGEEATRVLTRESLCLWRYENLDDDFASIDVSMNIGSLGNYNVWGAGMTSFLAQFDDGDGPVVGFVAGLAFGLRELNEVGDNSPLGTYVGALTFDKDDQNVPLGIEVAAV
jgi:hypothetical protein